jgi:hypothetical protein
MDGPRQDPFASLRANTLIWIAAVIWLVWGAAFVAILVVIIRSSR